MRKNSGLPDAWIFCATPERLPGEPTSAAAGRGGRTGPLVRVVRERGRVHHGAAAPGVHHFVPRTRARLGCRPEGEVLGECSAFRVFGERFREAFEFGLVGRDFSPISDQRQRSFNGATTFFSTITPLERLPERGAPAPGGLPGGVLEQEPARARREAHAVAAVQARVVLAALAAAGVQARHRREISRGPRVLSPDKQLTKRDTSWNRGRTLWKVSSTEEVAKQDG